MNPSPLLAEGVSNTSRHTSVSNAVGASASSAVEASAPSTAEAPDTPLPDFTPVATIRRPDGQETQVVRDRWGSHLLHSPDNPGWVRVHRDGAGNWIERETGIVHATDGSVIHPKDIFGASSEGFIDVNTKAASTIKPDPVRWLWPGWLAAGKVHLLAGAPGTGKTTVSMALAATVSLGGRWPDGTEALQGDVLIWSGEDDIKDTLVPRLMAVGADLNRVHFITTTNTEDGLRAFDPAVDIDLLADKMAWMDPCPSLLIVDPIVAAVSGDSHRNAEVRRALQPLVDLAASRHCAVLGISHFSKGSSGRDPIDRVTGSLAFGALARVVMATARLPDDHPSGVRRILARAKSNIGEDGQGFGYDLELEEPVEGIEATRVLWGEMLEGSARELLSMAEPVPDGEGESNADVESFVRGLLADGPVSAKQMKADADGAGYSWDRVKRAASRIGVERRKEDFSKGWVWSLSTDHDGRSRTVALEELIRDALAQGERTAQEMKVMIEEAGYSWDQGKRTAAKLGIERQKSGYQGPWTWTLGEAAAA
ncbi:AAA family ATPase [Thiorhodococcus fuscus]|uniref:AAA family ATPase n=1 Tax=Thiorhodococcus fuscus TaxID=527200 RepID=A0ABW4Y8V4_9GAMM